MRLSGYNLALGVKQMRYPFEAAIHSALDVADEFCVAYDPSYDDPDIFLNIDSRVNAVEVKVDFTEWDCINKALTVARRACMGDWCLFLENDEVLHERDSTKIISAIGEADARGAEAIAFSYMWMCQDYVDPKAFNGNLRQKITVNVPYIYHKTADYMIGLIESPYMDGKRLLPGYDDVSYYDERIQAWFNSKDPVVLEDYAPQNEVTVDDMEYKLENFVYVWHYCQYNWGRKIAQYRKQTVWQRRTYGDTAEMDLGLNERNMQSAMVIDPEESKRFLQERVSSGWCERMIPHPQYIAKWLEEMCLEAT